MNTPPTPEVSPTNIVPPPARVPAWPWWAPLIVDVAGIAALTVLTLAGQIDAKIACGLIVAIITGRMNPWTPRGGAPPSGMLTALLPFAGFAHVLSKTSQLLPKG